MKASIFVVSTLLCVATSPAGSQESGIELGARAPAALVHTLDGKPADIGSYMGGKPTVLYFWAFWCSSCKALQPAFMSAQRKHGSKVRFVAVAVSVSQTPNRVKSYAARHKYRHLTLFDTDGKAAEAYDVPATSYVVVVNAKGDVVYTGLGGKQDLDAAIRKAFP